MSFSGTEPGLQPLHIDRPPLRLVDDATSSFESTCAPWPFLSHWALKLVETVPSASHTEGLATYHSAFTVQDVVSTVRKIRKRALRLDTLHGRVALSLVQSMIAQGWIVPFESTTQLLPHGEPYGFFRFNSSTQALPPSGIVTDFTPCYSSTCGRNGAGTCYSFSCRVRSISPWSDYTSSVVSSHNEAVQVRTTEETLYAQHLRATEALFGLMLPHNNGRLLDYRVVDVIGVCQALQSLSSRLLALLEVLGNTTPQRMHLVCNVLLNYATYFGDVCPIYISCLHEAVEQIYGKVDPRHVNTLLRYHTIPGSNPLTLETLLRAPAIRLRTYIEALEGMRKSDIEVASLLPTIDALHTAERAVIAESIRSIGSRGPGVMSWDELVPLKTKATLGHTEAQRQALIFELITTEGDYLQDLELVEVIIVQPLRDANPFVVQPEDTTRLLNTIFRNIRDLLDHHRRFFDKLLAVQREEHPFIQSVAHDFLYAAGKWNVVYQEYVDQYSTALSRVLEEQEESPVFRQILHAAEDHPHALGRDIYAFLYLPIARLVAYESIVSRMLRIIPRSHHEYECLHRLSEALQGSSDYSSPLAWRPPQEGAEALQMDSTTGDASVSAVPPAYSKSVEPPHYDSLFPETSPFIGGTQDQINDRRLTRVQSYVSHRTATTYHTANESLPISLQRRRSIATSTTYWSIDDPALRRINNESDFRALFHEIDVTDKLEITSVTPVSFGGQADVMQGRLEIQFSQFQTVAVKIIRPSSSHADRVRKLAREIGIWHTLTHPHIIPLLGLSWSSSGLPGMVSPWCRNGNAFDYLSARQDHGDFRKLCMGVLRDTLKGLAHLHGIAVIHGDIKGANILISDDGRARLSDFGVSAVLFEHPSRTTTGGGTYRWMAPDLFHEHASLTRETDIWAIGCVILELASLHRPYYSIKEEYRVIIALHSCQIPPRPPGVPEELWTTCLRCFALAPSMRPSAEMLRLLLQYRPGNVRDSDQEPLFTDLDTTSPMAASTSPTQLPAQENLVSVQIYEPATNKLTSITVASSIDLPQLLAGVSERLGRPVHTLMYSRTGTYIQPDMKPLLASQLGWWLQTGNRMLWVP